MLPLRLASATSLPVVMLSLFALSPPCQCKHQIAARLAQALGRCTERTVSDGTLAAKLAEPPLPPQLVTPVKPKRTGKR